MSTLKPAISATDLPDEWYAAVRQAMSQHEGVPIKADPLRPCIVVWSINREVWQPLQLPGDGILFNSFDDRNVVLRRLEGK